MPTFHFFSSIAASGRFVLGAIGPTTVKSNSIAATDVHRVQNATLADDTEPSSVNKPYGFLAVKAQMDALGRQIAAMEAMVALICDLDDLVHPDQPGILRSVEE